MMRFGASKFWTEFPRRVGESPTTSPELRFFCVPPRVTTCTDTSLRWMEAGWVGKETMSSIVVPQKEGCRSGFGDPGRGDAAVRSWRIPDLDDAAIYGERRQRRVQRSAWFEALL